MKKGPVARALREAPPRDYGRAMVNAGDSHYSQCAGFASSPRAFSTDIFIV